MYAGSHFIVDVDVEFLGDLQCRSQCVRDLVVKSAGAGPAAHLNLQTFAVYEYTGFFAFKDLVLQCSTLNCLPIRLLPLNRQRGRRRSKP